ncbi:hypothetical protein M422DRAFT_43343 [Sphaerobolus stellatus SS14]|nr:hypothetical protein M422DRAFT_43343 [Sphaerobolus stellatus SS14]
MCRSLIFWIPEAMFKRIAKRQRRQEEEEELGLDYEAKQVLGLQDTDSDESDFSSEEESSSGNESDDDSMPEDTMDIDGLNMQLRKRDRGGQSSSHGEDSEKEEANGDEDEDEDEDDGGSENGDNGVDAPMSAMDALSDPMYDVPGASKTQDIRACVICPGKLFKNANMVKDHLESKSHIRRMKRYKEEVERLKESPEGLYTDSPRDILLLTESNVPEAAGALSKRTRKKGEWKDKLRSLAQQRRQARKDATAEVLETQENTETVPKNKKKGKSSKTSNDKATTLPNDLGSTSKQPKNRKIERPVKRQKTQKEPIDMTVNAKFVPHTSENTRVTDGKTKKKRKKEKKKKEEKNTEPPPLNRNTSSFYFADDEKPAESNEASSQTPKKEKELPESDPLNSRKNSDSKSKSKKSKKSLQVNSGSLKIKSSKVKPSDD